MEDKVLKVRLEKIIESAKHSKRYCKQTMIKSHQNVCVYGLGQFFQDVFEDRGFKEKFGVNYLSDRDEKKWGQKFYDIECVNPNSLKDIEDLIVILLVGGDTTTLEKQFREWGISCVAGYEVLIEMSLGTIISQEDFEKNQILDVFDSLSTEKSREIYVELLANRLAPEYSTKSYRELVTSKDYFDPECYEITDQESFVDCGAFNGDTIQNFLYVVNNFDAIYSFEMDESNYKELLDYVNTLDDNKKSKIYCFHAGVWNEKSILAYGNEEKSSKEAFSILKSGNRHEVVVDRLDNILKNKKVTFIKMDIEGSELKALMGAEEIIKMQKPKLAICIYHKLEDFWEIATYLKSIVPDYQFEVRHHHWAFEGSVLYAR